jgi:hypothetical protein
METDQTSPVRGTGDRSVVHRWAQRLRHAARRLREAFDILFRDGPIAVWNFEPDQMLLERFCLNPPFGSVSADSEWRWGTFASNYESGSTLQSFLFKSVDGLRQFQRAMRKLRKAVSMILSREPDNLTAATIGGLLDRLRKLPWARPVEGKPGKVWGVDTDRTYSRWTVALGKVDGVLMMETISSPEMPDPGMYQVKAQSPPGGLIEAIVRAAQKSLLKTERRKGGRPRIDLEARWKEAQELRAVYRSWKRAAKEYSKHHGVQVTAKQMEGWGRDLRRCYKKRDERAAQMTRAA